jgi:hypothetical protein
MDTTKHREHGLKLYAELPLLIQKTFESRSNFTDLTVYGVKEAIRRGHTGTILHCCRELAEKGILKRVEDIDGTEAYRAMNS